MTEETRSSHAVVIGGSIAGLLAARVLTEHIDRVTIVERDTLPEGAHLRKGVPQARHVHALLAQGQQIMEDLLPGLTDELNQIGAPELQWGLNTAVMTAGGWMPRFDSGIRSHAPSRAALEWLIRRRVRQDERIQFMTGYDVRDLMTDEARTTVTGVHLQRRGGDREATSLAADLVVDASGRESRAPQWLKALGYAAPQETTVNAYLAYATRWYKRPENADMDWKMVMIHSKPAEGINRGGAIFEVEGRSWLVTLAGIADQQPPTDEDAYLDFARTLASPLIYNAIKDADPLGDIYGYQRTANRLRHYERLTRRPENFVLVGDAVCAFNPLYGQGMTVAAMEALALREVLQGFRARDLTGMATRFHKRLAEVVKDTWLMATGEDLRYATTSGDRPGLVTRFIQRYIDRLVIIMPAATEIALALMHAQNLTKPPAALLHPRLLIKVLRHLLRANGIRQPADSTGKEPIWG